MGGQFVIQYHTTREGAHYDLMLEAGPALATWRLDRPLTDLAGGAALPAEALGDHRPAYLTYEGPVSGGRGWVRIFEQGSYELIDRQESLWVFRLRGRSLEGTFTLHRCQQSRWLLLAGDARAEQREG